MILGKFDETKKVWSIEIPEQEWYSVQDVARITGTGGPSVYSAIKRGTLVGYMVGGRTKIMHDDLIAYLARKGSANTLTAVTDSLIQKILPDPTNTKKATSLASAVALERPELNLDLFDEDDSEEDVNAEGDYTNDPSDAAEVSVTLPS